MQLQTLQINANTKLSHISEYRKMYGSASVCKGGKNGAGQ